MEEEGGANAVRCVGLLAARDCVAEVVAGGGDYIVYADPRGAADGVRCDGGPGVECLHWPGHEHVLNIDWGGVKHRRHG